MIEALAGCNVDDMSGKLYSITDHLEPPMDMLTWYPKDWEWSDRYPVSDELKERVLQEIRHKVGLAPDDHSPEAADKILTFVYEEITSAVLANGAGEAAQERMGQRGILWESLYRIRFAPQFEAAARLFSISRRNVRRALKEPVLCQHFPASEIPGLPSASLYFWERKCKDPQHAFGLLIQSHRQGAQQTVTDAWRFYYQDFYPQYYGTRKPLPLWKLFAQRYGRLLRAGGRSYAYIEQQSLAFPLEPLDPERYRITGLLRPSPQGEDYQEVLLAFALDLQKYCRDLRRHGVPADGSGRSVKAS